MVIADVIIYQKVEKAQSTRCIKKTLLEVLFWILNQKPTVFKTTNCTCYCINLQGFLLLNSCIKYNIQVPTLFPAKHRYYFVRDGELNWICSRSGKGFFTYRTQVILRFIEHLCNHKESRFPDRPECVVEEGGADSCRLNYGKSNFANC